MSSGVRITRRMVATFAQVCWLDVIVLLSYLFDEEHGIDFKQALIDIKYFKPN